VLVLKTYDDVKDRSPLICNSGAVLVAVMAWREFSRTGEMSMRFWLMLLTVVVFVVAAMLLVRRHRIMIEVTAEDSDEEGQLKIIQRGNSDQVISKSQFGYVKLEENRVIVHHYEDEDLRRTSFSTKGASKKGVAAIIGVLESWQTGN